MASSLKKVWRTGIFPAAIVAATAQSTVMMIHTRWYVGPLRCPPRMCKANGIRVAPFVFKRNSCGLLQSPHQQFFFIYADPSLLLKRRGNWVPARGCYYFVPLYCWLSTFISPSEAPPNRSCTFLCFPWGRLYCAFFCLVGDRASGLWSCWPLLGCLNCKLSQMAVAGALNRWEEPDRAESRKQAIVRLAIWYMRECQRAE